MSKRPDNITDEHLLFLDGLRESGVTNMFGAGAYIVDEFEVSEKESRSILKYWMDNFGESE